MAIGEYVLAAIKFDDDSRPSFFNAAAGETFPWIRFFRSFDMNNAWPSKLRNATYQTQLAVEDVRLFLATADTRWLVQRDSAVQH